MLSGRRTTQKNKTFFFLDKSESPLLFARCPAQPLPGAPRLSSVPMLRPNHTHALKEPLKEAVTWAFSITGATLPQTLPPPPAPPPAPPPPLPRDLAATPPALSPCPSLPSHISPPFFLHISLPMGSPSSRSSPRRPNVVLFVLSMSVPAGPAGVTGA